MKFYDIGETVKRAVAQVARTGVRFLTVHGSGAVMRAAVEGRGDSPLKLLAVTVLTSFDERIWPTWATPARSRTWSRCACARPWKRASTAWCARPLEVADGAPHRRARGHPGDAGGALGRRRQGDQKRVATPAEAIRNGANYLVIGRQVTRAADPARKWRASARRSGNSPRDRLLGRGSSRRRGVKRLQRQIAQPETLHVIVLLLVLVEVALLVADQPFEDLRGG